MLALKRFFTLIYLVVFCSTACLFAQSEIIAPQIWQDVNEPTYPESQIVERPVVPLKYRTISTDVVSLKNFLQNTPKRFSAEAEMTSAILELPMPNSSMKSFKVTQTQVMHPDLAAKYPEIKTYTGVGIDDPTSTMVLTINPSGIRGMILSTHHKTVNIRPYATGEKSILMSYFISDLNEEEAEHWDCGVWDDPKVIEETAQLGEVSGDCKLRTYELALACTGGYAQEHGGSKSSVMNEMVSTVANLNGRLEREAGIRFELIPNNEDVIFLNASSDPYTEGNKSALIAENQSTCNSVIGSSNYDIGHLFSVTGGGLARLNSVCGNKKAEGVSGLSNNPTGYYFETIVLHELGHQFSAGHTQNNPAQGCNRSDFSAREPGSGSTIMSYAGVCAPNIQFPADDYYHAVNLTQIQNFTIQGGGNNCPTIQDVGNMLPSVSVGPANTMPTDTYFELEGTYTNPDGDPQTFTWDQQDNEVTPAPPTPNATGGPVFRSLEPGDDPKRVFPNIDAILAGTTPEWEVLPGVERDMSFTFNVRDIHDGIGCAHDGDVDLEFWEPPSNQQFRVIEPENLIAWYVGDMVPVQWSPAGTHEAPVNATGVDILLSTDGGYTYPHLLAENVPNEPGLYELEVPNIKGTQNRIKVKGSGNYFFDISDFDFTIEDPPVPTFLFTAEPFSYKICSADDESVTYELSLLSIAGFEEEVSFEVLGLPMGATATFDPEFLTPGGTVNLTIGNLSNAAEGLFEMTVNATSENENRSAMLELEIIHEGVELTNLVSPDNGQTETTQSVELNWSNVAESEGYYVEVATNPAFGGSIILDTMVMDTFVMVSNLEPFTVYYWRVIGNNFCGKGGASEFYSFQTEGSFCQTFTQDVPVTIPEVFGTWPLIVQSKLDVPVSIDAVDMNITDFYISHTYVADLQARLISPAGTVIEMFDQPGRPSTPFGCFRPWIMCTFNDDATLTAEDFEHTCEVIPPTIQGDFQTIEPLSTFLGEDTQGEWTLEIQDWYLADSGGDIEVWSLEFCVAPPDSLNLSQQTLQVLKGEGGTISQSFLESSKMDMPAAEIIYTVLSLPANGSLFLDGNLADIGDQFSQEDIDNDLISYTHDDSDTLSDSFNFDVLDSENVWISNQTFVIEVVNLPSASAVLVSDIDCHDANNGQIEAQVSGGVSPFEYSIDGASYQSDPLFDNLSEGTYTLTIKDANGNTATSNAISITNPPALMGSTSVDVYTVTVTASGGTGNLSYSFNGVNFQSNNVLVVPGPNTYTITVKDENDCELLLSVETIFTANSSQTSAVTCYGGSDGAIEVSVTGGAPDFEYSLNGQNFQASNVFDNLPSGNYTVTVKDAVGYAFTTNSVNISDPPELTISAFANDFDITANGNGGTGNLEYSIDGNNYQASNMFTVANNGTYTVFVKDENDCVESVDVEVAVNTLVVAANLVSDISCHNADDGSLTATVSGGQNPYQYSLDGIVYQSSPTFDNLPEGTYMVTILDNEGFTKTTNSVTITNPPLLTVSTSSNNFDITANGNGGTGNLEYSIDGNNYQASNMFTVANNGQYTVTVRDENGCLATSDITISINTLNVAANLVDDISCNNANDGSIEASVSGGQSPYQYSLDGIVYQGSPTFDNLPEGTYTITILDNEGFTKTTNSVTITNPPLLTVSTSSNNFDITANGNGGTGNLQYSINGVNFQASNMFTVSSNGQYTVTVRDENGCLATSDITIFINTLNVSASLVDDISCNNANDGSIEASVSGGTMPYEYSIDGMTYQSSPTFNNLAAGTYTITVLDAEGFTLETNEVTVTNPPAISATTSVSGYDITVTAQGGTGGLFYSLDEVIYQVDNVFPCNPSGSYTVTIVDESQCLHTVDAEVDVAPLSNIVSSEPVTCFGGTDGTITANASGGVGPYQYSLDDITYQDDPFFDGLEAGQYSVLVKDVCDFTVFNIAMIDGPSELTVSTSVTGPILNAQGGGGVPPYQYSIDGVTFQDENEFGPLSPGSYDVLVLDASGCQTSIGADITYIPLEFGDVTFDGFDCASLTTVATICVDGGQAPYTFTISPDNTPFEPINGPCDFNMELLISSGSYDIVITDDLGYTVMTDFNITLPDPLEMGLSVDANNIDVNPSGGTAPYTVTVNGQPAQFPLENLPNDTYEIVVEDSQGCTVSETVVISKTREALKDLGFEIMPNPSNGKVLLQFKSPIHVDLAIRVTDELGRTVYENQWERKEGLEKALDLEWLANGVYQVILTDGEFLGSQKLVIVR